MKKERKVAIRILDEFEEFLYDRKIKIPNKERDNYDGDDDTQNAILFGSDYYSLEDTITKILEGK